jgi:hypothetical protein
MMEKVVCMLLFVIELFKAKIFNPSSIAKQMDLITITE